MTEGNPGKGTTLIDGVSVYEGSNGVGIYDIPSDAPGDTGVMYLEWGGNHDPHVRLTDTNPDKLLPTPMMRFRNYYGAPRLPMVSAYLNTLKESFLANQGREIVNQPRWRSEGISYGDPVKVELGVEEDDFEIRVTDITEDEEVAYQATKFMDIVVGKDGNVKVTMRVVRKVQPTEKSILFMTAENGGKFPVMAQIFAGIARGIRAEFVFDGDDLGTDEIDDGDDHEYPDSDGY